MLKTTVSKNAKSKISSGVTVGAGILAGLIVLGYLTYIIFAFAVGASIGITQIKQPISQQDPLTDIQTRCEQSAAKELCIVAYTQGNIADLDSEDAITLCNQTSGSERAQCYSVIASHEKNQTICDGAGSVLRQRQCKQQYKAFDSFSNFAPPAYADSLSLSDVMVGIEVDEECVDFATEFEAATSGDLCFVPVNVTNFTRGKKDLHEFDYEMTIYNSKHSVVDKVVRPWGVEGVVFLRDDTLNPYEVLEPGSSSMYYWLTTPLGELEPDNYTFTFIVYDDSGRKQVTREGAFAIVAELQAPKPRPHPVGPYDDFEKGLAANGYIVGYQVEEDCEEEPTRRFKEGDDDICILGDEVSRFGIDKDQFSIHDVSLYITDSKGNLVEYTPAAPGDEISEFLRNGILRETGIWFTSEGLEPDTYTFELRFFDLVDEKQGSINGTFWIE